MAEKLTKKKVLIIEDTASVRGWVAEALRKAGFECQEAEDGASGLAAAKSFLPDIILCDVDMPFINGFEVLKTLREIPETASISFIFTTGIDSRESVRKGMSVGADDYLTKPFTVQELLSSIHARLEKRNVHEKQAQKNVESVKKKIIENVFHDPATKLPNRQILQRRFREISKIGSSPPGALLSIAINNLGYIAEAFGSRCRDFVVKATAQRLKHSLGSEAEIFVGTQDSFNVLIFRQAEQERVRVLMEKIIGDLNQPFLFEGHNFRKRVSIGCGFFNAESGHAESVLDHAEIARRHALKEGDKGYCFYLPDMRRLALARFTMEDYLSRALDKKEFILYFQPQVHIQTNRIRGLEALIRWRNEELGLVSPLDFIPMAEKTGFINPIGAWVLNESARQLKEWQAKGGKDLRIAVNISGKQLESGNLVDEVDRALERSGLSPESLELEITESLLVENTDSIISQMKALKKKGVMIAIDDFGTGYSSLGSLKKFPFDTLKIDRSFIRDLAADASSAEIVSAIVKIAQTLKLKTIAEGVETLEQLDCLKGIVCDEYQGFLFSKPVPDAEILPLVARH